MTRSNAAIAKDLGYEAEELETHYNAKAKRRAALMREAAAALRATENIPGLLRGRRWSSAEAEGLITMIKDGKDPR